MTAATPATPAPASASAQAASPASIPASAPATPRAAPRGATRLFNPLALLVAGRRWLPLYAVIEHRGRRTGKAFRTPVVVHPTQDGFVVPLPWGERTDWCRNVRAAGGCVIRWRERDYPLVQPEVIDDPEEAGAFFGAFQRAAMRRLGITRCLRLRHRHLLADTSAPGAH